MPTTDAFGFQHLSYADSRSSFQMAKCLCEQSARQSFPSQTFGEVHDRGVVLNLAETLVGRLPKLATIVHSRYAISAMSVGWTQTMSFPRPSKATRAFFVFKVSRAFRSRSRRFR